MSPFMMLVFALMAALAVKEARYYTPHMLFTRKSIGELLLFAGGVVLLVSLTLWLARGFWKTAFGCVGIGFFVLAWCKQGASEQGVLTVERYGKELRPWNAIARAEVTRLSPGGKKMNRGGKPGSDGGGNGAAREAPPAAEIPPKPAHGKAGLVKVTWVWKTDSAFPARQTYTAETYEKLAARLAENGVPILEIQGPASP